MGRALACAEAHIIRARRLSALTYYTLEPAEFCAWLFYAAALKGQCSVQAAPYMHIYTPYYCRGNYLSLMYAQHYPHVRDMHLWCWAPAGRYGVISADERNYHVYTHTTIKYSLASLGEFAWLRSNDAREHQQTHSNKQKVSKHIGMSRYSSVHYNG